MPLERCVCQTRKKMYAWCDNSAVKCQFRFAFHDITYNSKWEFYKLYTFGNWIHIFYSLQTGFPILLTKEKLTHPHPFLSWWPLQLSASEDVDMQMVNTLASFGPVIHNQSKAFWSPLFAQATSYLQQMTQNLIKTFDTNSFNHFHGNDRLQRGIRGTFDIPRDVFRWHSQSYRFALSVSPGNEPVPGDWCHQRPHICCPRAATSLGSLCWWFYRILFHLTYRLMRLLLPLIPHRNV